MNKPLQRKTIFLTKDQHKRLRTLALKGENLWFN
jgi:hypothetical protein